MTSNIGWKKIRILVTNKCNYHCPFCHNEGQDKIDALRYMNFDDVSKLITALHQEPLEEINFSGGEPFLNKRVTDMIVFANTVANCDIRRATNLSLITDEQLAILRNTRVKFNIQFPFIDANKFKISTGSGDLNTILSNINKVKEAGIAIGLNMVVQSANVNDVEEVIHFALEHEIPLKLLPQIGLAKSFNFKRMIFPILDSIAVDYKNKKTGAKRWVIAKNGHATSVLYIDSPCFYKNIEQCRNYSEIRILPDMSLQSCILSKTRTTIDMSTDSSIINSLSQAWKNFNQCC